MGLYEIPLTMSLLGFWDGDYVHQLPYVWRAVFKHARDECESMRDYVF